MNNSSQLIIDGFNKTINCTVKAHNILQGLYVAFGGASQVSDDIVVAAIIGNYNNGGFNSPLAVDGLLKAITALIYQRRQHFDDDVAEAEIYLSLHTQFHTQIEFCDWDYTCHGGYSVI